jgi:hypothetical protein
MTEEITILESGKIKITNLRAVFAEKTYSVSNITSVETKQINPSGCLPFGLVVASIIFFMLGVTDLKENWQFILFALLSFGLFIVLYRGSKPSWAVSLTTASGEVKAYESPKQDEIKKIVDALNNAIVQKG